MVSHTNKGPGPFEGKLFIFDIDGTVVESVPYHELALDKALAHFNVPKLSKEFSGKSTDEKISILISRGLLSEDNRAEVKILKLLEFENILESVGGQSPQAELITTLINGSGKVVWFTQSNKESARALLKAVGLVGWPIRLEAGVRKDSPGKFLDLVNSMGFSAEDVVVIEDSVEAADNANKAKLKTILVANSSEVNHDLLKKLV